MNDITLCLEQEEYWRIFLRYRSATAACDHCAFSFIYTCFLSYSSALRIRYTPPPPSEYLSSDPRNTVHKTIQSKGQASRTVYGYLLYTFILVFISNTKVVIWWWARCLKVVLKAMNVEIRARYFKISSSILFDLLKFILIPYAS